jgi:HlyD family secretion protein
VDPQKLYRKAALEKLSSPEQLDVMMQVTSPASWLALIGIGAILVALIVWGIVGSIPIKVHGKGILMRGQAVLDVTADGNGRLSEILVRPGENVQDGHLIARLDLPDLELRIDNTREELETLSGQAVEQREAQTRIIAQYRRQAQALTERIQTQTDLVSRGLLTNSQLLQTKEELTITEQRISEIEAGQAARANRIEDVRRTLRELENRLESDSEVRCSCAGRVLEIKADPGDLVSPGDPLVSIEAFAEPIKVVIYVPAADGKKVQPGMEAYVSPSTVRAEEYGFVIGKVETVSDYPVTPEGLNRVLRNERLVNELTGTSAPIEVTAYLVEDPTTPSGFKWSSSNGPPTKIFSGTPCTAAVTVERKRPVSYVLPIFRRAIGVS